MSAESGKPPAFDLDAVTHRYYDHEAIGEEVVWPLVDMYWRGDWRQESAETDRLIVKKEGRYNKKVFDAYLSAHNLLEDEREDGNDSDIRRSVAIIAAESLVYTNRMRRWIMGQAEQRGFQRDTDWTDADKIFKIGTAITLIGTITCPFVPVIL